VSPAIIDGETVRRPAGPWTPAVHALLLHFERVGFEGAPRVLGFDEEGREILTFVQGKVPGTDWTPTDDQAVYAVGKLLRALHDVQAGFVPSADAKWQMPSALPGDEVICHNDAVGSNFVFRNGRPVALIDWEFASPGSRLWDLAYASVWLVPLHSPEYCLSAGWGNIDYARRLRLFCDSYGLDGTRHDLLDVVSERQARNREQLRAWASQGILDPSSDYLRLDADAAHLARLHSELERALA